MPVHSLHVFDRKGKTLFTKCYAQNKANKVDDGEQLSEKRKLVFGMLFSLKEVAASLSPSSIKDNGVHSVQTGASTCYCLETASGLRFALYITDDADKAHARSIRKAMQHAYNDIWIQSVVRSPLYNPVTPNVQATNFETNLDAFLVSQSWYR